MQLFVCWHCNVAFASSQAVRRRVESGQHSKHGNIPQLSRPDSELCFLLTAFTLSESDNRLVFESRVSHWEN